MIFGRVGLTLAHNGFGLGEGGELEAQMFNKPQMLIEVQMFNFARMPHFCQTPVSGSFYGYFVLMKFLKAVPFSLNEASPLYSAVALPSPPSPLYHIT